jgi:hypothetical protein
VRWSPIEALTSLVLRLFLEICWMQSAVGADLGVIGQPEVVRSRSGQFLVRTVPLPDPPRAVLKLTASSDFVRLQPSFLAVSCERIRQALIQQLGGGGSPWQGKIYVALYPAATSNDTVYVTTERFTDGWQYQVRLPQVLGRERYVGAITQVLLLELRQSRESGGERRIPTWLSDGLARSLCSARELQLVLASPSATVNGLAVDTTGSVQFQAEDPLKRTHAQLSLNSPLSFHELSWPAPEQLQGEAGELFRACAQLFVKNLLSLPDGPACLRALLKELPRHLNWQFAFLRAFHKSFQRPLDVEKWWALQTACFAGRDLAQTWATEESRRKLDEALRIPVEIRGQTNELPLRAETTLQTIVRDWAPQPRIQVLQAKLDELQMMRVRLVPEMVPLLDGYLIVLSQFLEQATVPERGMFPVGLNRKTITDTVKALDALDAQRKSAVTRERSTSPGTPAQASSR